MKSVTFAWAVTMALTLGGCSSPTPEPPMPTQTFSSEPTPNTQQPEEATKTSPELPEEWTQTEVDIFNGYVSLYPFTEIMDLTGKRALMENSHLICEAYGQGYSRREIQGATTGGSMTAEMSDDWMTLSVTYLCPEYFDLQVR